MNKNTLIAKVAEKAEIPKTKSKIAIETVLSAIENALRDGESIQIASLGTFKVLARNERTGRNPQTGEPIHIPAKLAPVFSPSKSLKETLNKD